MARRAPTPRKQAGRKPAPRKLSRRPTHLVRARGGDEARMVDVGAKDATRREATARALVRFPPGVLALLLAGKGPKGPVREMARAAGILAAKRTSEILPLCHPLALDVVDVRFARAAKDVLEVRCRAACRGSTGVEMEALSGVTAAALCVYDMAKALDHGIQIERVELLEKRGGLSGTWKAPGSSARRAKRAH